MRRLLIKADKDDFGASTALAAFIIADGWTKFLKVDWFDWGGIWWARSGWLLILGGFKWDNEGIVVKVADELGAFKNVVVVVWAFSVEAVLVEAKEEVTDEDWWLLRIVF